MAAGEFGNIANVEIDNLDHYENLRAFEQAIHDICLKNKNREAFLWFGGIDDQRLDAAIDILDRALGLYTINEIIRDAHEFAFHHNMLDGLSEQELDRAAMSHLALVLYLEKLASIEARIEEEVTAPRRLTHTLIHALLEVPALWKGILESVGLSISAARETIKRISFDSNMEEDLALELKVRGGNAPTLIMNRIAGALKDALNENNGNDPVFGL